MGIRREGRITAYKPVLVHGFDDPNGATSLDYSQNGLGIVTRFSLSVGDTHIISCRYFWPLPREATVVWVRQESSSSIRAGMLLH